MVSQREIFKAGAAGADRHLLDRGPPVGPRGMRMQVAAQIGQSYQMRETLIARGLDLAAILAQFGWNPREAELSIDIPFFCARHQLAVAVKTTFVEQKSPVVCGASDLNVMRLGVGETNERSSPTRTRRDAEADLNTAVQDHGGSRRVRPERFDNSGKGQEAFNHRVGVGR